MATKLSFDPPLPPPFAKCSVPGRELEENEEETGNGRRGACSGGGLVSAALLAGAGGRREEQEDKIYLGHRWSVGRSAEGAREGREGVTVRPTKGSRMERCCCQK